MESNDENVDIGDFSDSEDWASENSEDNGTLSPSSLPFHDRYPSPDTEMNPRTSISAKRPNRDNLKVDRAPPTGHRIPLDHGVPFPDETITGPPPFRLPDGSPLFIGSGLMSSSVHPCKIDPSRSPACVIPYDGSELGHLGRYDLLPFDPETMEWVPAQGGRVPPGRMAIEGGYEDHGIRLYHAIVMHNGIPIPCKTATHLVCQYCHGFYVTHNL